MSQHFYFDIWAPDDYTGTALGELSEASDRKVRESDQSIGEGSFEINRHSPQAAWCEAHALVRVRLTTGGPFAYDDPRYVAAFILETSEDVVLSEDEEGGEVLTRGGPSVVSILRRAVNYPNANIPGHASYWTSAKITGDIIIKNKTVGEAFRILILNAMQRTGNLPGVTIDFTITDDSAGTPWPDTDTDWRFPVGMSILEALSKLVSSKSYYRMGPDLLLQVFEDHPGTDLSGSVTFSKGESLVETASKTIDASGLMSRALVRGQKSANELTYLQVADAGVEAEVGRIEGYVEYQTTPTTARLTRAGQQAIDRSKLQQEGPVTAKVYAAEVPFVDYTYGDVVTVDIPGVYDAAEVRIATIQLVETEAGEYDVIHEYQAVPFDPATGPDNFASSTGPGTGTNCGDCPEPPPFVPDVSGSTAVSAVLYGPTNSPDRAFYPRVAWYGDGDAPPSGYASAPKTGPIEYVDRTVNGVTRRWALRALADMTVDIVVENVTMAEVLRTGSWTSTTRLIVNGAVVHAQVTGHTCGSLCYFTDQYDHTESGYTLHAGDVVEVQAFWSYGGVPVLVPAGTDGGSLSISGTAGAAVAANEPIQGQWVGEEVVVAEGDTTYATNYAYSPNGLHVYAEGVHLVVDQTDPTAGTFALANELPAGTHLFLWYQATTGDYLGTGNPPAPGPRNGIIPYPLLGADGDGSGDHVLYDDGIWRSPADVGGGGSDCCSDEAIDRATLNVEVLVGGTPGVVQSATAFEQLSATITVDSGDGWVAPTPGHYLVAWHSVRGGTANTLNTPTGWTPHPSGTVDGGVDRAAMYYKVADGSETSITAGLAAGTRHALTVVELDGNLTLDDDAEATGSGTTIQTGSVTPTGSVPAIIIGGAAAELSDGIRTVTPGAGWTELADAMVDNDVEGGFHPRHWVAYQAVASTSGSYNPSGTASSSSAGTGGQTLAFIEASTPTWVAAPDVADGDDTTYDSADAKEDDAFARANLGAQYRIGTSRLLIGFATSGSKTLELYGANESDYSDEVLLATETLTATGSYTGDEVLTTLALPDPYQYYRWKQTATANRRMYTWELRDATLAQLHEHALDDLSDVDTTGVADGDVLGYDDGTNTWVPLTISGSVPSGTDPGDLLVWDGDSWEVLAVGADDEMLYADSGETLGIRWGAAPSPGGGGDDPIADVFGTPDTAFEFNTTSTTGLTAYSPTPDVIDIDTTVPGHLYIKDNASGTARCGYYASAPSAPFTAICKLSDANVRLDYHQAGLAIGEATPGTMNSIQFSRASRFLESEVQTPTGFTSTITSGTLSDIQTPLYFAIVVNSSSDVDFLYSYNGRIWAYLTEARNPGITIGSIGLWYASNNSSGGAAAFDFLRIWTSAKTFPGIY